MGNEERESFLGKCSEPRLRGDFREVASLATPSGMGAESIFKDFPGDLFVVYLLWRSISHMP
jgi:hypothetical protein